MNLKSMTFCVINRFYYVHNNFIYNSISKLDFLSKFINLSASKLFEYTRNLNVLNMLHKKYWLKW